MEYIPVLSPRIQQVHLVRGQLAVQLFGGAGKGEMLRKEQPNTEPGREGS